ncbi:MAG: hypothetical protein MZV64_49565 [Ignavibacteriales bacterium]|nr:hypothetical protein [Ignavibacteriales bacterium]
MAGGALEGPPRRGRRARLSRRPADRRRAAPAGRLRGDLPPRAPARPAGHALHQRHARHGRAWPVFSGTCRRSRPSRSPSTG